MEALRFKTTSRSVMQPVTRILQKLVQEKGWDKGALLVFCPHTTAGLTINENADPDVAYDMTIFMDTLVPGENYFRHAEGNSDAHIKTSLFGPQLMLIVEDGTIQLGTWQGIYFCEWDGPRHRTLWIQFMSCG